MGTLHGDTPWDPPGTSSGHLPCNPSHGQGKCVGPCKFSHCEECEPEEGEEVEEASPEGEGETD